MLTFIHVYVSILTALWWQWILCDCNNVPRWFLCGRSRAYQWNVRLTFGKLRPNGPARIHSQRPCVWIYVFSDINASKHCAQAMPIVECEWVYWNYIYIELESAETGPNACNISINISSRTKQRQHEKCDDVVVLICHPQNHRSRCWRGDGDIELPCALCTERPLTLRAVFGGKCSITIFAIQYQWHAH